MTEKERIMCAIHSCSRPALIAPEEREWVEATAARVLAAIHPEADETSSERGFIQMEPVPTSYGATVRFAESSNASGPHIWMWTEQPPPEYPSMLAQEPGSVSVHMAIEEAEEIHRRLGHMIRRSHERWRYDWEPETDHWEDEG